MRQSVTKLHSAESWTFEEFSTFYVKKTVHDRVHQKPVIFPIPGQMHPV